MSLPKVPDITPKIKLTRDQMLNLLAASIALEEIALAHIINAEAEKIQYTLCKKHTVDDLLQINNRVNRNLRLVIKKEMLLQFKLEDVFRCDQQVASDEAYEGPTDTKGFVLS